MGFQGLGFRATRFRVQGLGWALLDLQAYYLFEATKRVVLEGPVLGYTIHGLATEYTWRSRERQASGTPTYNPSYVILGAPPNYDYSHGWVVSTVKGRL